MGGYPFSLGARTPEGKRGRAMRFPESPREGTEAHTSALRRLDAARVEQRDRSEAHEAARDSAGEPAAADELSEANEQVAAREAWVGWIERGY